MALGLGVESNVVRPVPCFVIRRRSFTDRKSIRSRILVEVFRAEQTFCPESPTELIASELRKLPQIFTTISMR